MSVRHDDDPDACIGQPSKRTRARLCSDESKDEPVPRKWPTDSQLQHATFVHYFAHYPLLISRNSMFNQETSLDFLHARIISAAQCNPGVLARTAGPLTQPPNLHAAARAAVRALTLASSRFYATPCNTHTPHTPSLSERKCSHCRKRKRKEISMGRRTLRRIQAASGTCLPGARAF